MWLSTFSLTFFEVFIQVMPASVHNDEVHRRLVLALLILVCIFRIEICVPTLPRFFSCVLYSCDNYAKGVGTVHDFRYLGDFGLPFVRKKPSYNFV
jgi:hypothetical protein